MAKTIKGTTDLSDEEVVIVKVICSECSPYGEENQEIDFVESEVESAIAKGFIKASKAKAKPVIQEENV